MMNTITEGFKIIGLSICTSNKNQQAKQDLGKLWEQFYGENLMNKIPNQLLKEVIAIYTDYKSDYTEEYTAIIGLPVSTLSNIPKGLIGREFAGDKFLKFTAKGAMPQAVVNTWLSIWQNDKALNRKYSYDFEVYGADAQKGEDSEVDIYIAVK